MSVSAVLKVKQALNLLYANPAHRAATGDRIVEHTRGGIAPGQEMHFLREILAATIGVGVARMDNEVRPAPEPEFQLPRCRTAGVTGNTWLSAPNT